MRFPSVRTFLHVAGAVSLAALTPYASAQVTLNLTTAQQTNCTAVTDSQGLRLVPGGTDLAATGVTLTGTGCGGGPVTSDFQAAIQVPGAATAGTPFAVNWSAGAAATQCTYGGTAGLTGWPVGSSACQGTACNGSHQATVTVPNPGSYSLNVTCTNASGYATGSGTATTPPTAPVFTTALAVNPATVTLGQSIAASWAVNGATSCQGTAELGGVSTTLVGWNDTSFTASPRTLTPTQVGTYSLKLVCQNANGSTTSGPATVVVQSASTSCPAGRINSAKVCYNVSLASNTCTTADVTQFSNIWGRNAPSATPVAFPGVNYFAFVTDMSSTGYIAAQFTVPQNLAANYTGMLSNFEQGGLPNMTMSISSNCGDFNPSTATFVRTNIGPGSALGTWKNAGISTYPTYYPLTPGETYYVNFKPTSCTGATCTVAISNNRTLINP